MYKTAFNTVFYGGGLGGWGVNHVSVAVSRTGPLKAKGLWT